MNGYVVALDQGTTSSRAIIFDAKGKPVTIAQYPFPQIYPKPGWVEHDPMVILETQFRALAEAFEKSELSPTDIAGIGITNQRETTIVWDKNTGKPVYNAIVWQCRRTAPICDVLAALGGDYAGYKMESEPFERTSLGAHAMVFAKGDEKINVGVVIKDTVAPTAEGIDCQCSTGYYCEPIKFVTNVADMSKVTAKFVNEPDWSVEGEQNVQIVLTDRAGNETTVEAKAIIAPDTTAPVIYAARDRYCYVGEAVSYFKEVFAEDNADPEPEIEVDKSKVDAKTAGTYDVTYTATDHEGNTSSVTVKYTFVEKKIDDAKLDEAVDKVIGEIITDDMSVPEQAYAIFDYCYSNIIYTGTSDKTDWKSEAYRGLTEGVGDCFTFYSASYALLQKIDCQVLSVERLNGKTQHFWCLVNLGTGWYHFDACNVGPEHLRCFMKTSEELVKYSVQYWRFDTSLYPPLETTPYSMS